MEKKSGRYVFIVDQTLHGQQGQLTENTYSTGNRQRRPRKGVRYSSYEVARKSCHCFVMGLLITPSGFRIPFFKPFYTKDYCRKYNRTFRTQTELGAELVQELPLPDGAEVVVLGVTAFDAESVREACDARQYDWITPVNAERVLAGRKPRPKVRSLVSGLRPDQFHTLRLFPGQGELAVYRRVSRYRIGPKVKPRKDARRNPATATRTGTRLPRRTTTGGVTHLRVPSKCATSKLARRASVRNVMIKARSQDSFTGRTRRQVSK